MSTHKIKIVHIIGNLGGGGRERRMLECVKGLAKDGKYSQYLILLYNIIDYTDVYNMNVQLKIMQSKSNFKKSFELIKEISLIKPDIVHCWTSSLVTLPAYFYKKNLKYKIIAGFISDGNVEKIPYYRVGMIYQFRKADKIISNSKAGIIAKKAPYQKSEVVYNGFSFDRFKKFPSYDKYVIKENLGIKSKYVISMNARFLPVKDWDTFLEIAYKVGRVCDNVTFLAVGQGALLPHYKEKAKELAINNVVFTGFIKDIDKVYFISDICLLCTNEKLHAEGVSNSIMEAMAAGKPVIATMGGGTPEIIENGVNGIIISPHDSDEGAQLIIKLLSDNNLMHSLGTSAIETIREKFSLSKMIEKYKEIYEKLLE